MPALRRWDSDESDVPMGPGRYDPTSSASSAGETFFCSILNVFSFGWNPSMLCTPFGYPRRANMRNSEDETADESDSDETSSTTSIAESGPAQVDLTLQRLQSLQGMTTTDGDPSSFSKNGVQEKGWLTQSKTRAANVNAGFPLGFC